MPVARHMLVRIAAQEKRSSYKNVYLTTYLSIDILDYSLSRSAHLQLHQLLSLMPNLQKSGDALLSACEEIMHSQIGKNLYITLKFLNLRKEDACISMFSSLSFFLIELFKIFGIEQSMLFYEKTDTTEVLILNRHLSPKKLLNMPLSTFLNLQNQIKADFAFGLNQEN